MLIQFTFENYKSFRDETTLDLSSTKMTEYASRVVTIGSEKILPVAAIYGANASGKSNIYSAFEYMSHYVLESFKYGDDEQKYKDIKPKTFLFDNNTTNKETTFEIYFTVPNDQSEKIYNYRFCLGESGINEEWFNYKAKTARKFSSIFYRDNNTLDLKGIPKSSRENIEIALEKQVLIISLGAKLKIEKCKIVRDWFLNNEFADFADAFTNFYMYKVLPKGFVENEKVRKNVIDYISSFDDNIKDFKVTKIPAQNEKEKDSYLVDTLHQMIGSDEMINIPLSEESSGTLKMFSLYQKLQDVLDNGGVFFIDELNARLHPLLVRNFILTFLNPDININHAQLIFTTHDTWQLSNQLLRRDEIWFNEKDNQGISTLYSLADFVDEEGNRIRKDESYEKNYLLGKYGAIPSLKSLKQIQED